MLAGCVADSTSSQTGGLTVELELSDGIQIDEICVDATDGACTKTLCTNVTCPDDIPPP